MRQQLSFLRIVFCCILVWLSIPNAEIFAQTLKTDDNLPALDACGAVGTFKVRIQKSSTACSNPQLKIYFDISKGVEYVPGQITATLAGTTVTVTETAASSTGATLLLPQINDGDASEELVISYGARAKCDAIGASGANIAHPQYTLENCGAPQIKLGEDVNTNFAVLKLDITNSASQIGLSESFSRTLKVSNTGNGSIGVITIDRTLGAAFSNTLGAAPVGWSFTTTTATKYVLTANPGVMLNPGDHIDVTETLTLSTCTGLSSSYEAYYGCDTKCTSGGANSGVVNTINTLNSGKPLLKITAGPSSTSNVYCFDQSYNKVWTVKNDGDAYASDILIDVEAGTSAGSSYIVDGTVMVNGVPATIVSNLTVGSSGTFSTFYYGANASKNRMVRIRVPNLAPGASAVITFQQHYSNPAVSCPSINTLYREATIWSGSYTNRDECVAAGATKTSYTIARADEMAGVSYIHNAASFGNIDISDVYNVDYRVNNWQIPHRGVTTGSEFKLVVELSPNLSIENFSPSVFVLSANNLTLNPTITKISETLYELKFVYGSNGWTTGGILDNWVVAGAKINFPVKIDCSQTQVNPWIKIRSVLTPVAGCTSSEIGCVTINLTKHCPAPCDDGGLVNQQPVLQRRTYGQYDKNPDNTIPDNPGSANINPDTDDLTGIETTVFSNNDLVRITQTGHINVVNPTNGQAWNRLALVVTKPSADATAIAVELNSGMIKVQRGATVYTASGLTVINNTNTFELDVTAGNLAGTNGFPVDFKFLKDDIVTSSVEFRYRPINGSVIAGSKHFPTAYHLKESNIDYSCSGGYTAVGYFARVALEQHNEGAAAGTNITNCDGAITSRIFFRIGVGNFIVKNAFYKNEYRNFTTVDKVQFTIPAGLTLKGVRVYLYNNSLNNVSPINETFTLPTPVTNGVYDFDVLPIIANLKSSVNLDEGYDLYTYPILVSNCASQPTETFKFAGYASGTFLYNGTVYYGVSNHRLAEMTNTINTGVDGLKHTVLTTPSVSSATGQGSWIVEVRNNSTFRSFTNAWIALNAGTTGATITSVQKVPNSNGTGTPTAVTNVNGIYQLGNFGTSSASSYYKVTVASADCGNVSFALAYGADCGAYPTTVAAGECVKTSSTLHLISPAPNLQTSFVTQPLASSRPKLCEALPYVVEINNAGLGTAKDIYLEIPLPPGGGLSYIINTATATAPYSSTPGAAVSIAAANISADLSKITINIPASIVAQLQNGQKIRVALSLKAEGCTFQSGNKIAFKTFGNNSCGTPIALSPTLSSNRITIDGAPSNEPVLAITNSQISNVAVTGSSTATATYNFTFGNPGTVTNTYPATNAYKFGIKLPSGWTFSGDPSSFVDASKANYIGTDPTFGYVYQLTNDLTVGNSISLVNVGLTYTGNIANITCNANLGNVVENVYTTFNPGSVCTEVCNLSQVTVSNTGGDILLPTPTAPTLAANKSFCSSDNATIASLISNGDAVATNHVWYDSPTATTPLASNTALVHNKTYYLANMVTTNATCQSSRVATTVNIVQSPIANAGADQTAATATFTLAGSALTGAQTGIWTEIVPTGGTSNATIANATTSNSVVTVAIGKTATLRWTVTNGDCVSFDDMIIESINTIDLSVTKTADKAQLIPGTAIVYTIVVKNNGEATLPANTAFGLDEQLPSQLTDVSYNSSNGTYNTNTKTFTPSTALVKNGTITLTIQGTLPATAKVTELTNTVSVTVPTPYVDNNTSNNNASVTTPVVRTVDLAVAKTASKTTVAAGEALNYIITITNKGASFLTSGEKIGFTDVLPNGYTPTGPPTVNGGTYNATTGEITLASELNTTSSVVVTYTGTVNAAYKNANIVNSATVTVPTDVTDPDPLNNSATVTTPVTRSADLAITKSANKTSVVAGQGLIYTVTITNNGISTLAVGEEIGFTDPLPNGYTANGAPTVTGGNYNATTGKITLTGELNTNTSVVLIYNGTVSSSYSNSTIVNTAAVTPPTGVTDLVTTNNSATVTTTVTRNVDLAITKAANKTNVVAGEGLEYTITITNKGVSSLNSGEEINFTDPLPTGFTPVGAPTVNGGTYNAATGKITLNTPLNTTSTIVLVYTGTVNANYTNTNITNTATVTTPNGVIDTDPSNNVSSVTTTVTRSADLAVVKTPSKTSLIAGDALNYTIVVTNKGLSTLLAGEQITFTDVLPSGYVQSGAPTVTGGTYNATANTITLTAPLTTSNNITVVFSGSVNSNFKSASITNTVEVKTPTGVTDPDLSNNKSTTNTSVTRNVDLAISKVASKTSVLAGESLSYTVTITNKGTGVLTSGEEITFADVLPSGYTTNGAPTVSNGTYNTSTGKITLTTDLNSTTSIVLVYYGTVNSNYADASIVNSATVTAPSNVTDTDPSNNNATVNTQVTKAVDLVVTKLASNNNPFIGTSVTFTLKVINKGPSTATNVALNEVLKSGYSYVSSSTNNGSYNNVTGLWSIGNMSVGQEVTLTVVANVKPSGDYSNTVSVNATEPELVPSDNTITIVPTPKQSPPVANDDAETTKINTPILIKVITNDQPGASGSPIVASSIEIMSNPAHGILTVHADGTVTYTPNNSYYGTDVFTYRVKDEFGFWSNVATVKITITNDVLKIPNVFTPNGDGANDVFEILGLPAFDKADLIIFNRWGNEVYKGDNYKNTWDGNGLNEGTYYYMVTVFKGQQKNVYKGWVVLKRN